MFFIENVGNLVCPAIYDLGQAANVVVLSVTEGEDKPLKYPVMFHAADLVLLTKCDLVPHLDVELAKVHDALARVMPRPHASARSGQGMDAWVRWVDELRTGLGFEGARAFARACPRARAPPSPRARARSGGKARTVTRPLALSLSKCERDSRGSCQAVPWRAVGGEGLTSSAATMDGALTFSGSVRQPPRQRGPRGCGVAPRSASSAAKPRCMRSEDRAYRVQLAACGREARHGSAARLGRRRLVWLATPSRVPSGASG